MWQAPTELPDKLYGTVAVDTEVNDKYLKERGPGWAFRDGGFIAGFSVKSDNFKGYLPIRHEGGGNMDPERVLSWVRHQMADPETPKVFANAAFDIGWMKQDGIKVRGPVHDVLVMAPLIDENRGRRGYNLDTVAEDYTGQGKDEDLLIEYGKSIGLKKVDQIKASMWRFPAHIVGPYAEQDAEATYQLKQVFAPIIIEQDLQEIYSLEMELLPIFLAMRERGIRVDIDRAEQMVVEYEKKESEIVAEIKRQTGIEVSLTASSSKAKVLRALGFEPPKTAKTNKDSVKADFLESLDHPIAHMMVQASKYRKARNDFIIKNILEKHQDGRVYGNFHQLASEDGGTVSGRLSSSKPNLQNQFSPDKDPEIGGDIRSLWLPEEGEKWSVNDYSSQEPRLTVHFAYVSNLPGAAEVVEKYHANPRIDYHQMVADICGITRKQAKPINLGLAYGMGEAKLCHSLGLPTIWAETEWSNGRLIEQAGPEGKLILEKYHAGVPFLKDLTDLAKKRAKNRGYITTICGRRCRFPIGGDGKRWFTHAALNRLIQGSAADQTKKAMVEMFKAGILPLVQVHDEIDISWSDPKTLHTAREIMINVVPLAVPVVVDTEVGPSWGHVETWAEAA